MAKTKISEFSSTPANNTDIDSIFIGEGMAPSNVNDAIRELMSQLKDWQSGASNDPYVVGSSGSLTLNQGTANGVAYLNGSKVVTSGSALVFDGTNLGLGVTPSAWRSATKAIQVGTGGATFQSYNNGGTVATSIGSNFYFNSSDQAIYLNSSGASSYALVGNEHRWSVAASGTAGNAITFTQAMTLDASGNLGIGTTSIVDISGGSGKTLEIYGGSQGGFLHLTNSTTGQTVSDGFVIGTALGGSDALLIQRENANMIFRTNDTERARIDSSGSLLVGTTSSLGSNYLLQMAGGRASFAGNSDALGVYLRYNTSTSGFFIGSPSANALAFADSNGTERARIDSSGNLLVGTTSKASQERFSVATTGATQAALFKNDDVSKDTIVAWSATTSGTNQFVAFYTEASLTIRGSITYNRGAGLTAYNVNSDYRSKDIYGPVTNSGTLIDSVPVYIGKMKGATQERPMFIAHETPSYAHTGVKDAVDADGNPIYQQMDASALIPVMWAEIQSLRKRLADAGI